MSDNILNGFHWTDGWFFQRNEDGSVRIAHLLRVNGEYRFPPVVNICVDADSWASIVASVSKGGEVDGRFYEAQAFHGSTGPNAERQRAEGLEAALTRYREGYQGACFACEPVAEANTQLRQRAEAAERERDELVKENLDIVKRYLAAKDEARHYRCFHCRFVFYDDDGSALEHFGRSSGDTPKCISAAPAGVTQDPMTKQIERLRRELQRLADLVLTTATIETSRGLVALALNVEKVYGPLPLADTERDQCGEEERREP